MIASHLLEGLGVWWMLVGCALVLGLAVGYVLGFARERKWWINHITRNEEEEEP